VTRSWPTEGPHVTWKLGSWRKSCGENCPYHTPRKPRSSQASSQASQTSAESARTSPVRTEGQVTPPAVGLPCLRRRPGSMPSASSISRASARYRRSSNSTSNPNVRSARTEPFERVHGAHRSRPCCLCAGDASSSAHSFGARRRLGGWLEPRQVAEEVVRDRTRASRANILEYDSGARPEGPAYGPPRRACTAAA
jgi:hypothetical protein